MKEYQLLDCCTGDKALYKTTFSYEIKDDELIICFLCEHSSFYSPYKGLYNANHYEGDVVEIFIGNDEHNKTYIELEITPHNDIFLAKITNENNQLSLEYIEPSFVQSFSKIEDNCYEIKAKMPLKYLRTGNGKFKFNAFRIETDNGIK